MKVIILILTIMLVGCASQRKSKKSIGNTQTKAFEYIDDNTFLITESAEDSTYGYQDSNPVKVGGLFDEGVKNERRFLNALTGPNGEEITYFRVGSCCAFKTPNGVIDNVGLLDMYRVIPDGSKDTLTIYINMYDNGDLKIPVGLKARTR